MKIIFVFEHQSENKYPEGIVIAVTPKACYDLDNDKIKYKIPEDYLDINGFYSLEEEFFKSQLEWINRIDSSLAEISNDIQNLSLQPAKLYGMNLKNITDSIYITAKIINAILHSTHPSEIFYFGPFHGDNKINWLLDLDNPDIFKKVLETISISKKIPFTFVRIINHNNVTNNNKSIGIIDRIKIFRRKRLNEFNFFYKTFSFSNFINKGAKKYLLLKQNWGLNKFIEDAIVEGNEVCILEDNNIYRINKLGQRKHMLKLNKEDLASVESDLGQVLLKGIIKNQVIMNWLNKQCEVNVDGYFLPIFQHFIYDVVPQLIHYCYSFNSIYKDISIDCVLTTHKWLLPEFAAMAVASQDSKIKCVQISHGFSIFDNNTWKYSEQPCDTYITSDEEISNYFKKHLKLDIDKKTPAIKISQSWLNNNSYENVNRSRQIKNITYSKKEIIFVPTMFTGHHLRFDGSFYLPTWYYKLQLYFIELFSQLKDFDFIYKGIKGNDVYYNPIELIIKDRFYDNVKFSNNRLLEEYKNADGVIMDYPSTPFIESLAMGIPSIAIYHRSLKIRQTAENKYKGIIYSFNKISECKKPIINFLNSIPNWPVYYYDNTQLNSIYHTL